MSDFERIVKENLERYPTITEGLRKAEASSLSNTLQTPREGESLREAIARALCKQRGLNPEAKIAVIRFRWPYLNWELFLEDADALLAGPLAQLQADLRAARAERDEARAKLNCPIGIPEEHHEVCSAGTCYTCIASRCVWSQEQIDEAAGANLIALAKMYGEACGELQVLRKLACDVSDEAGEAEADGDALLEEIELHCEAVARAEAAEAEAASLRRQLQEGQKEKLGASPSGSGSYPSGETSNEFSSLRDCDPSRMLNRLREHGPLEVDGTIDAAMIKHQCVNAVVLAYDAHGNDAIVHLHATFVHWLLDENSRLYEWAKDEQSKRHRAEDQRLQLRSKLAALGIEAEGQDAKRLDALHESPARRAMPDTTPLPTIQSEKTGGDRAP